MAQFEFSGIDDLILSMEQVEALPEYLVDAILTEQAEVLAEEIRLRGKGYGVEDSGKLLSSIKPGKPKKGKKGGRQIVVSARGSRKRGNRKVNNGEIAFLNNYGTRYQKARPFWSDAESMSEQTMRRVAREIYDRWLTKLGL